MQADVFDPSDASPLAVSKGTFDFMHLGMVLHIFGWAKQVDLLERCLALLKPVPGVMMLGQAVGDAEGTSAGDKWGGQAFRHSDETFRELWKEVEERSGLRFNCRASVDRGLGVASGNRAWDVSSARRLVFEVERLA